MTKDVGLWIQNVALSDVKRGMHFDAGVNGMLIQIVDPGTEFPQPLKDFREVHQFTFLDIEQDGMTNNGDGTMTDMSEFAVTQEQADQLVELLQRAIDQRMNVIVHCHAGVCRSGAVAEVGVMMGFRDPEVFRSPNLLVKHKMMKKLGWTYDENEPHTINGAPVDEDWTNDNEKVFTLADARRKYRERYEGDI
jgi:rhodanese-related sulfurtransferase